MYNYNSRELTLKDIENRVTISVDELIEVLNIGRSSVYNAIKRNEIPNRKIGKRIIIPVTPLLAWLNSDCVSV